MFRMKAILFGPLVVALMSGMVPSCGALILRR
jgi:hypothetical protein